MLFLRLFYTTYNKIGSFEIASESYGNCKEALEQLFGMISTLNEVQHEGKCMSIVKYVGGDLKSLALLYGINAANSIFPCVWCTRCKSSFDNHDTSVE